MTGQLVERFARKYLLVEKDEELAKFVLSGLITSEHGILLYKTLHYLPPYYREIVLKYPTIDPLGLKSLRRLEVEFKDEFISIIQTGFLDNGRDTIPLGKLTERDVDSFFRRLKWEEGQTRKELVGEIQKAEIEKQGLHILDGINIAEGLTENAKKRAMVYLFPEGAYTAEQLAKMLEQNKFGVLFIAAYTENEPDLRFHDNVYVKPSQVNGVKPNYFLNAFKQSISI